MEDLTNTVQATVDNGETEVQITTVGEVVGSDSEGKPVIQNFSEEALEKIAEKHKDDEILVDADHESERGGSTEAKGWLSKLRFVPGKGLFGRVRWTDIGRRLIENRVFRWLSPSFWIDGDTKTPVEMTSVALTNKPAQAGQIKPIVNSAPVEIANTETETEKDILAMSKEELEKLVADVVAAKLAEAEKAEAVEEVKEEVVEEVKEEVVENACSEEEKKAENEEPEVKVEVVETKTEPEVEEKEEKEDVIKLEALNSQPKTEGIDIVKNSKPIDFQKMFSGIKVTRVV